MDFGQLCKLMKFKEKSVLCYPIKQMVKRFTLLTICFATYRSGSFEAYGLITQILEP
jgi:hypothetical protein